MGATGRHEPLTHSSPVAQRVSVVHPQPELLHTSTRVLLPQRLVSGVQVREAHVVPLHPHGHGVNDPQAVPVALHVSIPDPLQRVSPGEQTLRGTQRPLVQSSPKAQEVPVPQLIPGQVFGMVTPHMTLDAGGHEETHWHIPPTHWVPVGQGISDEAYTQPLGVQVPVAV